MTSGRSPVRGPRTASVTRLLLVKKYAATSPAMRPRTRAMLSQIPRRDLAAALPGRVRGPLFPVAGGDRLGSGEPFRLPFGSGSWSVVESGSLLIGPHSAFVDLHRFEVEIQLQPGGQVTHPKAVKLVLSVQKVALVLEQLVGQGRLSRRVERLVGGQGGEQRLAGAIYLRVPEFNHPLLDLVKLRNGSQLADIGPDVVGDVVLEGHQRAP